MNRRSGLPDADPQILRSRVQGGHRILELCGLNGHGEHYRSDFPTFCDDGVIRTVHPVFWLNLRFVGDGTSDEVAAPRSAGQATSSC